MGLWRDCRPGCLYDERADMSNNNNNYYYDDDYTTCTIVRGPPGTDLSTRSAGGGIARVRTLRPALSECSHAPASSRLIASRHDGSVKTNAFIFKCHRLNIQLILDLWLSDWNYFLESIIIIGKNIIGKIYNSHNVTDSFERIFSIWIQTVIIVFFSLFWLNLKGNKSKRYIVKSILFVSFRCKSNENFRLNIYKFNIK